MDCVKSHCEQELEKPVSFMISKICFNTFKLFSWILNKKNQIKIIDLVIIFILHVCYNFVYQNCF